MEITGKIIVFCHEFSYYNAKGVAMRGLRYNTSISRKDEAGDYLNASLEVVFSKAVADEYKLEETYDEGDMLELDIKAGWLSCRGWEDKDGNDRRVLLAFINDVDYIEEYAPASKKPAKKPAKKASKK